MRAISIHHKDLIKEAAELIKLADFLQAENTEIFNKKFYGEDPNEIKELADRFYFIFKPMKDYSEYRSLANSISTIEELEEFLAKCDNAVSIISKKISSFGIRESGTIDMAKQFVQKYYKDLDFIIPKVNESNTEEDLFFLLRPALRSEKKKVNNEFEGKDISGLSKDYTDWILKIFNLSKAGGEAHSIDDIISLAKTFKSSEQKLEKKISEFSSYSDANNYLNDNSGVSKKVYTESIRSAAQENDMSRIVFNDDRWTVVLIGSTIGGQWWGRDTDFCISTIEGNLYSNYATEDKLDPYFIIDKLAQSSDPMRKFTIAVQYDESGKFKISNDSYTMTDARNIGITLDSIQAALGKDYNKVFESINRDAATREESLGTINNNKIAAKVSEKDYEFIRKYEKEIIANENLTESTLKGIKNTDDAKKVKNIIKSYAENDPINFLKDFINEPWAQPYIPIAAKSYINNDPYYFLISFSDEPWAEEYIPTAAKNYAKSDPFNFLLDLRDEPWAEPYLPTAVESDPYSFLCNFVKENWAQEYIPTAVKYYAEKAPFKFLSTFSDKSWAKKYIPTLIENCSDADLTSFLKNFIRKDWAQPYITTVAKNLAEKNPHALIQNFQNEDWAKEPREDLRRRSFIQHAAKNLAEKEPYRFIGYYGNDPWAQPYIASIIENISKKESSYSPKLTKLAKVLESLGLPKEASEVLRIR